MKTIPLRRRLFLSLVPITLVFSSGLAFGAPKDGSMRGPLPEVQRENICYMAKHHAELVRKVTLNENGYEATTTSTNEELAERLKVHFQYMEKRLGSGAAVRRWDPAFAEMTEHYDDLDTRVEFLDDGLRVIVTGKTPEAAKIAQNHARVVSDFVARGSEAVRDSHERVYEKSE